jgi:quercetin 2,3-dioxygenase
MSVRIISKEKQGYGAFNGGEIVENKPIVPSRDGATTGPYSNLFYWAHAYALTDSTIGLHPHQGFEICSFVLEGQIRHYDTQLREWRDLEAGDVQIIRSGNGISHSEFMAKGAEMFQIWFDPNLAQTMRQPATYDDYKAAQFPVETPAPGVQVTHLINGGSPFRMDTPGIAVQRIELSTTRYTVPADMAYIYSAYIIKGTASINGQTVKANDFIIINDTPQIDIDAAGDSRIFMIQSPVKPGYRTYADSFR